MYTYIYTYIYTCMSLEREGTHVAFFFKIYDSIVRNVYVKNHGVATTSRLLKIVGLFCRI